MGKFKFGDLEGYINYDWDSDNFDLKLSANVMDKKFEICNSQVQGVAQKLIGQHTDNLANIEYGSDEYKAELEALKPALDHHYAVNSHHP